MWAIFTGFTGEPGRCMRCGAPLKMEVSMPLELIGRDGFESGFYKADDPYTGEQADPHLTIPLLWFVAWVQGMAGNVRPEWKPKDKQMGHSEVFEGRYASGVHHSDAKYHTVLYRHVDAVVGARYRFEAQMMGKSGPKSGFSLAIGIDPYGGTDWGLEDVKWQWYTRDMSIWQEGEWHLETSPIVEAKSTRITLYLRAWCRFPDDAAAIFDDTALYSDEGQTPPAPPVPPPPGGSVDYEKIREIVREEVDKARVQQNTWWWEHVGIFLGGVHDLWEGP